MVKVPRAMAACGMVIIIVSLMWSMWSLAASAETGAAPRLPLRAAIHVHSTASTGTLSLEALATRAEQQGLDVLVLSENFTLRYDYGLQPLERFLKRELTFPSVMEYGIHRFLDEVQAVQQRHPKLILIPGVEVAPHYYWTGSLLGRDLTMHNAQRNLLVIGLNKVEDYASLPARGNPQSSVWDTQSVVNGLPLMLVVPALWVWMPRRRSRTEGHEPVSAWRRALAAIVLLCCIGQGIHAWPFSSPAYSSYDAQAGYRPYQALIDVATHRGGLVFWSMTEARDFNQHSFGPLGTVTVKTEPHPEGLVLTHGYTGFGGLYQDTRRVIAPGGVWDQLIRARVQDASGPTMIGEVAFHGLQDPAKDLDRVYTVVDVKERTVPAVLEALRSGQAYAVARGDDQLLLNLDDFRVTTDSGSQSARIGDRLDTGMNPDLTIHISLSTVDQKPHPARLRLIRSGQVIHQMEGQVPLQLHLADPDRPAGQWVTYRVEVTGKSGELLTNPIYIKT